MLVSRFGKLAEKRSGKILVMLALLLVLLMGMAGLIIDSGLLYASHRDVQNVADSAALAAAMELYRGGTSVQAKDAAKNFVSTYNGLASATLTVNIPPTSGPYAGNDKFAEVILANTSTTYLIQILGNSSTQTVSARAVAGYEPISYGEGAMVLDPTAAAGLSIQGGGTLKVDGSVIVNSEGAGVDQYDVTVDWGLKKYGLSTGNNSTVKARKVLLRGGVDTPSNFQSYDPADPKPLFARAPMSADPLRELPVPTTTNGVAATNGIVPNFGAVSINKTQTLSPGIYNDINISTGGNVTFNPGIYILSPTKNNQGLRISGNPTVIGNGVMFYFTGSNYYDATKKAYGYWEALDDAQNSQLDGPLPPTNGQSIGTAPDPGKVTYSSITINATSAKISLTGLVDSTSPFDRVLFYQRRRNNSTASIAGSAGNQVTLGGIIYAKWAKFSISGQGKYDAQFFVGSMDISGGGTVTIGSAGKNYGMGNQVFLTE